MNLDEQATRYRALDSWFKTPQGRRVGLAFSEELRHISDLITGKRLLQLGNCGENAWLSCLKFRHKWLINPCRVPDKPALVTSLTAVPLARDSIDCIVAPLTLEAFANDGKTPLDEMDRVLKPMGFVIFFGINPFGLWGITAKFGQLACFGHAKATLTSALRLKNMMLHRGYKQCAFSSFYYIPPIASAVWIQRLEFLNEMGKMIWPYPPGFYSIVLQKYQYTSLTPLENTAVSFLIKSV